MKKNYCKALGLLAIMLLAVFACSSNKRAQPVSAAAKYPATALLDDFDQLVRVIKKNHPALYTFTNQQVFDNLVQQQRNKITDSLPLVDFYKIACPLITAIGCGHSQINLPEEFWHDRATTLLPLRLFLTNGRAWVVRDSLSNKNLPPGTEIVTINGLPVATLFAQVAGYISTDGANKSARQDILNAGAFNSRLAIQQGLPAIYNVGYRDSTGGVHAVAINSIFAQDYFSINAHNEKQPLHYNLALVPKTAVVSIGSFGFYDRLGQFRQFIDSCFRQIKQAGITNLILDLRSNTGGDPFCSSYLFNYLAHSPVAYFDKPYPPYDTLARPAPLPANNFTGRLYVLTDGLCFSSSGHLCALLKYYHIGEFIGTETGGTFTCNDNSRDFKLINTGIIVRMPRATFTVNVQGMQRFEGVQPDVVVENTISDVLAGRDVAMQAALTHAKQP